MAGGDQFTTIDAIVAYGINNPGQTVGSNIGTEGLFQGFLDSRGNLASIDVPGASFTQAYGINDTGAIVGYFNSFEIDGRGNRGFLVRKDSFTTIEIPDVGYYSDAEGQHGLWQALFLSRHR